MQVAILIHGHRLVVACAEHCFGLSSVREVDAHAAILGFYIDECDMVLLSHGMSHAAHLHLDAAIIDACHYGEMLLHAGVYRVHGKLVHLLATAYYGYSRVNDLLYHITTMVTFEKFYCHNFIDLIGLYFLFFFL